MTRTDSRSLFTDSQQRFKLFHFLYSDEKLMSILVHLEGFEKIEENYQVVYDRQG